MKDRLGITLGPHEERLAVIRAHGATLLPRIAFGMLWVLLPFFLFFPLLRLDLWGWVFAGIVALGGVVYLAHLRSTWFGTALVVTNERCVDVSRKGFGMRTHTSVSWSEVVDIRNESTGFVAGLLGFSRIRLALRHGPYDVAMAGVRRGAEIRQLCHEVQCLQRKPRV